MAIADIAADNTTGIPWRTCQVCHALNSIPDSEAAGLRSLLGGTKRYSEIAELIAADPDTPLRLDPGALSRHARGRCEAKERLR